MYHHHSVLLLVNKTGSLFQGLEGLRIPQLGKEEDRVCEGAALPLELLNLKQVLMPRQWFLNKLDPRGDLQDPELLDLL